MTSTNLEEVRTMVNIIVHTSHSDGEIRERLNQIGLDGKAAEIDSERAASMYRANARVFVNGSRISV